MALERRVKELEGSPNKVKRWSARWRVMLMVVGLLPTVLGLKALLEEMDKRVSEKFAWAGHMFWS